MLNEKERLIKAIDQLSYEKKELLESKEYKLGNSILKTLNYAKKFQVKNIKNKIIEKHRKKIDKKKFYTVNQIKQDILTNIKSVEDKKIVVYSCITGNYDKGEEPLYYNDNVDYVMYTNCNELQAKGWKIRKIPEEIEKLNDNVLINRYIKMHPHELFKEYDYSIYIDGNIRTVSDISSFVNSVNEKTGLAIHKHYARNCIYQEAKVCELYKKGRKDKLEQQIQKYKTEGFPENYGLLECNVIVADLNNKNAIKILNEWWNDFVKSDSRRDQISLPYVLWKNDYEVNDIGNLGNNVRDNCKIEIIKHN